MNNKRQSSITNTKIFISFARSIRLTPDTAVATNKFAPYGGVINPIANATVITSPKCTGSIPNFVTIGSNIGVKIIIEEMLSTKHPTISKRINIFFL